MKVFGWSLDFFTNTKEHIVEPAGGALHRSGCKKNGLAPANSSFFGCGPEVRSASIGYRVELLGKKGTTRKHIYILIITT